MCIDMDICLYKYFSYVQFTSMFDMCVYVFISL